MATASATGYLKLDINGFQEAISSAKRLLVGFAGAFAAFKTVGFFKNGIQEAIDFGHEIHQASMRMGKMDPGNLLIAQKIIERMGYSSEEARGELEKMVESGKPLASMFKSADEYAQAIAAAKGDYGSQANVLSKSAKDFNAVFYVIKAISEKTKTLFMAATSGFVKPLHNVLKMLQSNDFSKQAEAFGTKIGEGLATLTQLFKDGKLWEYVKLGMQLAFFKSVEALKDGLAYATSGVMDSFSSIGNTIADAFLSAYSVIGGVVADIITGLGVAGFKLYEGIHKALDYLEENFTRVVDILLDGINDAISFVQRISINLINGAITFGAELLNGALDAIANIGKWMAQAFTGSVEFLKEALDKVFSNDWFQVIGNRFKALFSGFGSLIAEKMGADNVAEEYRNAAIAYDEAANVNLEVVKSDIAKFFANFAGKGSVDASGNPIDEETPSEKRIRLMMEQMDKLTGGKKGGGDIDYGPEGMRGSLGGGTGPMNIIADSLASIGGGGNYITSSLSPEAKEAMKANQQLKVIGDQMTKSNELLTEIKNTPPGKAGNPLMKK